jgi:hypothetical protein
VFFHIFKIFLDVRDILVIFLAYDYNTNKISWATNSLDFNVSKQKNKMIKSIKLILTTYLIEYRQLLQVLAAQWRKRG